MISSDFTNFEFPEKRNANIGQANAKVYCIGPQYDDDIPVKIIINISISLSITKYVVIRVSIYVKNVFLSVFSTFRILSINFNNFTTFKKIKFNIYIIL